MSYGRGKFVLSAVIATLSWSVVAFFLLFVDPITVSDFPLSRSYALFFFPLFLAIFSSFLSFFSLRRSFFFSFTVVSFLFLRIHHLASFFTVILLAAFLVLLDLGLSTRD